MEQLDILQQALNKAKIQLMSKADSAFFTTICFSLKHVWDDTIRTACTNGTEIRFSPAFFLSLKPDERVFLLLHEAMHVAYLHMDRLHTREPSKWNVAADHVINLMLIDRGFTMPSVGLADPQYKEMSTEEVYSRIPDSQSKDVDMDLMEPDGPSEALQQQVQDILVRAAIQSKMQNDAAGSIPGDIQIFLNKLLDPKLPWNRILQKYLQSMAKNDYTFRKPNRRFFPKHHLPSLYSENLMSIAVAVDTSGSVNEKDFTQFISEVHCILRMMKPEKLTLIQFDTEIIMTNSISSIQELSKVKFTGGGGTDINPVLEWTQQNRPQLLLVFTDGDFEFSDINPKSEVIWVIHNNKKFTSKFGKIINYKI